MAGSRPKEYIRDVEVDDGRQQQSTKGQRSIHKASTARTAPPEELTYLNAGKQDLTGFTNACGIVKGNGNAGITFGSSGDQKKQADALKCLFDAINSKDDGKTQNGSPTEPTNNHPTPMPGRNFVNHGDQKLKALTNVIGCTEGDRNGAITFPDERT